MNKTIQDRKGSKSKIIRAELESGLTNPRAIRQKLLKDGHNVDITLINVVRANWRQQKRANGSIITVDELMDIVEMIGTEKARVLFREYELINERDIMGFPTHPTPSQDTAITLQSPPNDLELDSAEPEKKLGRRK